MGHLKNKKVIDGEAQDIETIVRLRPWIEDEWRNENGPFKKTILRTDYNERKNIFSFQIIFRV